VAGNGHPYRDGPNVLLLDYTFWGTTYGRR
jgi:hypothetical protein